MVSLYSYQLDALQRMHNGCILCGETGSGKSRTALAYYFTQCKGNLETLDILDPHKLYIITTAQKRDRMEWVEECVPFGITDVVIDSWNNVEKYTTISKCFFIFDEQRAIGNGVWSKSFVKIAKRNRWILLSATPGDTWLDYIPVFIANGFYKHRTEFCDEHVIWHRFSKYAKVDRFVNVSKLERERDELLVTMDFHREAKMVEEDRPVDYDPIAYKLVNRNRWDPENDKPIQNASELCYALRRVVNKDPDRVAKLTAIAMEHPKMIVFYNFDYELDILRKWAKGAKIKYGEYNGHNHDPIPEGKQWVYLVQYNAGSEGWNCIQTDTIVFYSMNYSYRTMTQAAGRIARANTPFKTLYYYRLYSTSPIDLAIRRAIKNKRNFNESAFCDIK